MEELDWSRASKFISIPPSVPDGISLKEFVGPDVATYLPQFWWNAVPVDTFLCFILGIIYSVGGIVATVGNFLVLFMFWKYDTLRKPSNVLVMNLAFCDLMTMITLVPESAVGLLMGGRWPFGYILCIMHGFCGGLFGYGQIITLTFISFDRYNVIVKGMQAKPLTFGRVKTFLVIIWCYALFWSVGPLVGFGTYGMDGCIVSCAFDFINRDPTNIRYILACFSFCFVAPLCFIVRFYYSIVKAVWQHEAILREQAKKMNVASLRSNEDASKVSSEIRIAKVAITNVALWLLSWTPFAVVALIGVIGNQDLLTPTVTLLPANLAKISCIYNPLIYAISHPKYKECLKKAFPYCFCCIKETMKCDIQSTTSETTKI